MTPRQLSQLARQWTYRKKLAETVETLEDGIKMYMQANGRQEVTAGLYQIRLKGQELSIKALPKTDPRQLKLKLKRHSAAEDRKEP